MGDYDYYWFSSNITAWNPNQPWDFVVSVQVDSVGMDVDLYVSALDARYPTSEDYDFFSDNLGPDDIHIEKNNKIF